MSRVTSGTTTIITLLWSAVYPVCVVTSFLQLFHNGFLAWSDASRIIILQWFPMSLIYVCSACSGFNKSVYTCTICEPFHWWLRLYTMVTLFLPLLSPLSYQSFSGRSCFWHTPRPSLSVSCHSWVWFLSIPFQIIFPLWALTSFPNHITCPPPTMPPALLQAQFVFVRASCTLGWVDTNFLFNLNENQVEKCCILCKK